MALRKGDRVVVEPNRLGIYEGPSRLNLVRVRLDNGRTVDVPPHTVRAPKPEAPAARTEPYVPPDVAPGDLLPNAPPGRKPSLYLCVVAKSQREAVDWLQVHAHRRKTETSEDVFDGHAELDEVSKLVVVINDGGRYGGYGAVAEKARLDALADGATVFGLSHADTEYKEGALGVFRDTAAAGSVAGMVGRPMSGHYVWSSQGGMKDPSCLDGCAIFFRLDSGLKFDPKTFDGYHCVGEDLVLCARTRGIPIIIPACKAEHASTSNFVPGEPPGNRAWLTDYAKYVARLRSKYPDLEFLPS